MSNWHFSANPVLEKIATGMAAKLFGHDWETTVYWKNGVLGKGSWAMTWAFEREKGNFLLDTVGNNHYESIDSKTPARLEYSITGDLVDREFFTDGLAQDPEPGIAAYESYYPSGTIMMRRFCTGGETKDTDDGHPGQTQYYEDGGIQQTWRPKDTAYGEPAVVYYDSEGMIAGGFSISTGQAGTSLTDIEASVMLENGKKRRVEELCRGTQTLVAGKSTTTTDASGWRKGIGRER